MEHLDSQCAARSIGPANNLLSTFVSTLFALHCNFSTPDMWPPDFGPRALNGALGEYDFVIVGAGTAGSVVAGRLAENIHHKILLLEAGGDPPVESEIPGLAWTHFHTDFDWKYVTESNQKSCLAMQNESCVWHKGKVLGGSHSINSMIYMRGNSRDFDNWVDHGNDAWGWDDAIHYFRKTENFTGENRFGAHGTYGPMNVEPFQSPKIDQFMILKAAEELGYKKVNDFVAGQYLGFGKIYGTVKSGRRMSTAKAFLSEDRPNLHVIKNALATKISFTTDMKADQVTFVYQGQKEMEVRARKEVILSAGSVETPKLLMLSGIGSRKHLTSLNMTALTNLAVGNNLRDHVRVDLFLKLNYRDHLGVDLRFLDAFYNQWVNRNGTLGGAVIDVTGFIDTDSNGHYPDIQIIFTPITSTAELGVTLKPEILGNITNQISSSDRIIKVSVVLLKPKSKGFVRLRSANYNDPPIILSNYLQIDTDVRTLAEGLKKVYEFEKSPTIMNLDGKFLRIELPECDAFEYQSPTYLECYIKYMSNTMYDPVGTVKMGPKEDKFAVVNTELKVRGTTGLRVIDASIMPRLVSANINPAVIMIAEKGADLLKAEWED